MGASPINPETMSVVVRVFEMLAAGHAINVIARTLDDEGVLTPRGGAAWFRKTLRDLALDDVYRPHDFAELEGLVPAPVLAALDPVRELEPGDLPGREGTPEMRLFDPDRVREKG